MQEKIALPTVGRIVLLYIYTEDRTEVLRGPYPAIVSAVYEGDLLIQQLCAFMPDGPCMMANVRHVTEYGPSAICWDWMTYQKGQAAKTEQLQAELDKKSLPK